MAGHRSGRSRWRRASRWALGGLAGLLLLTAVYYVGLIAYVDNGVQRSDVLRLDGPEILSAQHQLGAENFLLVGSDGGDRDTTILAHRSRDGSRAVVVVFPRDAYVDVPACEDADGQPTEPYGGPFSSVFGTGGAGCLVHTVQVLTGLRINHYVQMDLAVFPDLVDAVGGVPMCLASPLREGGSGLNLPAGQATIHAAQTLPFLRLESRQGVDETERIQRQQQFLASLLDRSLAPTTVVNPVRFTRVLTSAADSLTLDPATSLGDLRDLVELLQDPNADSMLLLTAPIADPDFTPVGSTSSYLLLDEQLGRQVYRSIIEDTAVAIPDGSSVPRAAPSTETVSCGRG